MAGKKFQFRLQTVLKLRRLEAERAKVRLGQATAALVESRQRLRRSQEDLDALISRQQECDSVQDFRRFSEMRSAAIDRTETLRAEVRRLTERETAARRELGERMRDQKALDELRTRQLEEHLAEIDQAEQKILDELGVIGYSRTDSPSTLPCE